MTNYRYFIVLALAFFSCKESNYSIILNDQFASPFYALDLKSSGNRDYVDSFGRYCVEGYSITHNAFFRKCTGDTLFLSNAFLDKHHYLQYPSTYQVHDKYLLFRYNRPLGDSYNNYIHLYDSNGVRVDRILLSDTLIMEKGKSWHENPLLSHLFTPAFNFKLSGKIIFQMKNYATMGHEQFDQAPRFLAVEADDPSSYSVHYFPYPKSGQGLHYPGMLTGGEGGRFFISPGSENKVLVGFPHVPTVYLYDLETRTYDVYQTNSDHVKEQALVDSLTYIRMLGDKEKLSMLGKYSRLFYDEGNKRYYRFFRPELKKIDINDHYNRSYTLGVYDEQFEKITEIAFPRNLFPSVTTGFGKIYCISKDEGTLTVNDISIVEGKASDNLVSKPPNLKEKGFFKYLEEVHDLHGDQKLIVVGSRFCLGCVVKVLMNDAEYAADHGFQLVMLSDQTQLESLVPMDSVKKQIVVLEDESQYRKYFKDFQNASLMVIKDRKIVYQKELGVSESDRIREIIREADEVFNE